MRKILAGVVFLFVMGGWLGGCAPLLVGGVGGYAVYQHEQWYHDHMAPRHMPMGVHR